MRTKLVFCLAAAITSAASVDFGVERLANSGSFGAGNYTDHSTLDVIPALCTGAVLVLFFAAIVAQRALSRSTCAPQWLRRYATADRERSVLELIPAIFALQIAALWSMETLEQMAVAGHSMGGTIWLGGPPLVSLSLHAAGCLIITWLLAQAARWCTRTITEVVVLICEIFYAASRDIAPAPAHLERLGFFRFLEPIIARLNGRAPPFLRA